MNPIFESVGKSRGIAILILDLFEEMLSDKNIMIPDDDREGGEDEACLYGSTYYDLEDRITDLINKYMEGTEDAKEPDRACQPDWKAMYEEVAAKNEDLRMRFESQRIQLERAWASLRTFEFVYGRKLDGIC